MRAFKAFRRGRLKVQTLRKNCNCKGKFKATEIKKLEFEEQNEFHIQKRLLAYQDHF